MKAVRFILGDQLSDAVATLEDLDADTDRVLMVEVGDEASYVPHHPKKVAFIFACMRHFAERLRARGVTVDYVSLDHPDNTGSFRDELIRAVKRHGPERIVVTEPGEWRVWDDMQGWEAACGVPVEIRTDERFLCSREDFAGWADGRKQLRMEFFYREMRRKTGLLMDGDEPVGGQWNFDRDNRKSLPADVSIPDPRRVDPDEITGAVIDLVRQRFGNRFGDLEPFWFAVTVEDAEAAFDHFVETALPWFGDYQDAMRQDQPTLFHAVCSLYLNNGLLDPLALCRRVENEYRAGRVPLNAAEGFIRQIIGWREYVRGIYWLKMPDYARTNELGADRPLPWFYWTGETDMNCLAQAIGQTKREAYAHHIQRLMVTGVFALLVGVRPDEINEWYLAVYADAYEWVELPNTHGMVMHADGGYLGSKPYAASGKYIDRMSDYCRHCRYAVKEQTGETACPFNYLYWDFIARHEKRLERNPRTAMPVRTMRKMKPEKVAAMRAQAADFLDRLTAEAEGERRNHAAD